MSDTFYRSETVIISSPSSVRLGRPTIVAYVSIKTIAKMYATTRCNMLNLESFNNLIKWAHDRKYVGAHSTITSNM